MKYVNTIKSLLVASFMGAASVASAQTDTVRPLHYPALTTAGSPNFYKNYVGVRFQVCSPAVIAGDKVFTSPNLDGTGSWAGRDTTMICAPVKFAPSADTNACSGTAFPAGYFNGKIALIWRGTCEFGAKALKAQTAGAIAVVIVNNVAGGPVGMGAGAVGTSVHIPVYMISLNDGLDITNQIHMGNAVTMTVILNWGDAHNNSDLGFVPSGYAVSAYSALPWSQINANPANNAYTQKSGAFVANYGVHNQTGVTLSSVLNWTPSTGTTATTVHSDNVVKGRFPTIDSIWAMFMPKYNIASTPLTGPGRFDLTYTISSDSTDGFPGDNTVSYSFYATDSVYSKGRYDFANDKPITTEYTGPGTYTTDPYMWAVPYYVANGGAFIKDVKFSVVYNLGAGTPPGLIPENDIFTIYIFKWVDTGSADGFMENAELSLVGKGQYKFGPTDSSFKTYDAPIMDTNGNPAAITTTSNSWYLVAALCNPNYLMGLDGVISGYPRAFGLKHFNNINDYYNPIWFGDRETSISSTTGNPTSMWANQGQIYYPWAFDGTGSLDVDSVNFASEKGLIPSLPMITTTHFDHTGVNNLKPAFSKLELFPNPASGQVNVTIGLDKPATQVVYTVVDGMGRFVSHETHHNVTNDTYSFSTSNLAPGNYYMIVDADDKTSSRKFVVVK